MNAFLETEVNEHVDDHVDEEIIACLEISHPVSFFLFAGAGSGKTRSLVTAVRRLISTSSDYLSLRGKRIGVITYTNAACDEIRARLEFNPLVAVSTIHSFVWELIRGFHSDIRAQLDANLKEDIAELEVLLAKGKPGTKAEIDRRNSIISKKKRQAGLKDIRVFTYNPKGDNVTRESLNHSEVIKIGANFLLSKPLMQKILLNRFPILLIDESQDANGRLLDSLLATQRENNMQFALGLFGDVMQRIYGEGKADLGNNLPSDWAKPVKVMNHRCPKRVVSLINKIREDVDGRAQQPRPDQKDGHVRLFIAQSSVKDRPGVESWAAARMAEITGDVLWKEPKANVKTLLLEHHMAAARMGFARMQEALYPVESFRTGLLDGSLPGLRLFSELTLPLLAAARRKDRFGVAAIVRAHSPLLKKANVAGVEGDQRAQIQRARTAVEELVAVWNGNPEPTFMDVLRVVARTGIFEIPEALRPIIARSPQETAIVEEELETPQPADEPGDLHLDAWDAFLMTPFSQISSYFEYVSDKAAFGTHQGVKGLEFPRVMVINDDASARGFLFGYEKLFGAKETTKAVRENEGPGNDTSISRTRRLLYVTCSRAEESLAVVTYSENPAAVKSSVIQKGWFEATEIEVFS